MSASATWAGRIRHPRRFHRAPEAFARPAGCSPAGAKATRAQENLMSEPPQNRPVQNPLTLVMKATSPQDYTALRQIVEHIQSLAPQQNPIVAALNKIANVHFARFVFLDPDQLAVITTYDGDFDSYINEFTNELGEVFDALLAHVAGAPPLPVQTYRQEFMDYIHAHDLRCVEPFYSAYPTSTVLDIDAVCH
jgi:hypothetical protein